MSIVLAQGAGFNVLQSLQSAFTQLVNYLPQIIGALIVLVVGYVIARVLRMLITKLLRRMRVDDRLTSGKVGDQVARLSPQGSPSRLVGGVLFAVIMLFVLSSAIGTLGIPALTGFMNLVLSYLPRVLAALVIFVLAVLVASGVGTLVQRTMGDTPSGRMVQTAAPTLVMAIAVFMILTQLRIAPTIVMITYAALVGAMALGSAIAFGLGGREAAGDMINSGYRRAQEEQENLRGTSGQSAGSTTQSWTMQSGAGGSQPQESGSTSQEPGGSHRAT